MDDVFVSFLTKVAPNIAYLIGIAILVWKVSQHSAEIHALLSKLTEGQMDIKKDVDILSMKVSPLEQKVARVEGHLGLNGFAKAVQ